MMDHLILPYKKNLNLIDAHFSRINHDDAIVAIVYKIVQPNGKPLILKICERPSDYLREAYFLKYFKDKLPLPRLIQTVEPEEGIHGAILMEYLPGTVLQKDALTDALAYKMGSLLAQIHLNKVTGYGDLIKPESLTSLPDPYYTMKFEEGLGDCSEQLPKPLIGKCQTYYDAHRDLLNFVDGPCIIHRDFRPGNWIVSSGKLQGIIDWSSARASFAEEDFCLMELHSILTPSFLTGYTSTRPLPDYSKIMPLLMLSQAVATIGFTVKRGTWNNTNSYLYESNLRLIEELLK